MEGPDLSQPNRAAMLLQAERIVNARPVLVYALPWLLLLHALEPDDGNSE